MRPGLRWQLAEAKRSGDWSAAATPLFDRSNPCFRFKSGVALRFPPQSKITSPFATIGAHFVIGLAIHGEAGALRIALAWEMEDAQP